MFNYFKKQKIRKHIKNLRKSKEGKSNSERLQIADEIDYWNDILTGKIQMPKDL